MKMEYLFVRKKDDFCQTVDQFKNHLLSNGSLLYKEGESTKESTKGEVFFSGFSVRCMITHADVIQSDENVYHMIAESNDEKSAVDSLDRFDSIMRRINQATGNMFQMNTIWDDMSDYYRNALYPSITKVENLLRKIIYRFMIRNVGQNWFSTSSPANFQKAVENVREKEKIKDIKEDHLQHADFIQLGVFFFGTYTLKPIDANVVNRLRKLHDNDKLDVKGYHAELSQMITDYESKSNWDRYFAGEIKVENLEAQWNILYGYRNQVAHSKRISKSEYNAALSIIRTLSEAFEECLQRVDRVKMNKEEMKAVVNIAEESILLSDDKKKLGEIELRDAKVFLSGRTYFSPSTMINEDGSILLRTQPIGVTSSGYVGLNSDGSYRPLTSSLIAQSDYISFGGNPITVSSIVTDADDKVYVTSKDLVSEKKPIKLTKKTIHDSSDPHITVQPGKDAIVSAVPSKKK